MKNRETRAEPQKLHVEIRFVKSWKSECRSKNVVLRERKRARLDFKNAAEADAERDSEKSEKKGREHLREIHDLDFSAGKFLGEKILAANENFKIRRRFETKRKILTSPKNLRKMPRL